MDVTLTERHVDLVVGGFDVGPLAPFMPTLAAVVTRRVERVPSTIVASPDYWRQNPAPDHPSEPYGYVFAVISPSMRKPG
ncbi:hypothetical protein SAMN04487926_10381 [Paraburkholderia steynii]|uniref:Uncharacterized protein n=1 Tax=Paraburkholderia steynii TaxID=1245441 RepID=A0A7Z7B3Q3_9BURK|nr:hypothetical protein [Paraburkholderia steynii]SDH25234.1 hypothetical protein SAMN04487926_10381 [Paraburkholderia steynii]